MITATLVLLSCGILSGILLSKHLGIIFVWLALVVFKFWFVGSLILSLYKGAADTCHKTVPLDRFISGTWFCSEEDINKTSTP